MKSWLMVRVNKMIYPFFKDLFWGLFCVCVCVCVCVPFLMSFLNLLQRCFYFMFWFFGHDASVILAPWLGIKCWPPHWHCWTAWEVPRWFTVSVTGVTHIQVLKLSLAQRMLNKQTGKPPLMTFGIPSTSLTSPLASFTFVSTFWDNSNNNMHYYWDGFS